MGRTRIGLALCVLMAASAAACGGKLKGKSTIQVYQEALAEGAREIIVPLKEEFKRQHPLGYEEPVVPVMIPPETMLIWIYPHNAGSRLFVHGHWVQYVLKSWQWNPELIQSPDGAAASPISQPLPLHPESKTKAGE